jgi:hypothetical protein
MPGDATQLALLPGILYLAPAGSTEPADLVTPWDPAWVELGYTAEGSKWTTELSMGEVLAAEEIDPIHIATDSRKVKVSFVLLQLTATNLRRALNGGTIVAGGGFVTFEPHEPGDDVYIALGHESHDGTERHVFREGKQIGNVETERKRGGDSAKIPAEFQFRRPAANLLPWKSIMASPLRA